MGSWFDQQTAAILPSVLAVAGREITYRTEGGVETDIRAVLELTAETEPTAPGVYAAAMIATADLASAPAAGDEVDIGADTYKVFDVEASTGGAAVLKLRKVF